MGTQPGHSGSKAERDLFHRTESWCPRVTRPRICHEVGKSYYPERGDSLWVSVPPLLFPFEKGSLRSFEWESWHSDTVGQINWERMHRRQASVVLTNIYVLVLVYYFERSLFDFFLLFCDHVKPIWLHTAACYLSQLNGLSGLLGVSLLCWVYNHLET